MNFLKPIDGDVLFSTADGEEKDGRIIEKGTACKMARGEMVRFMAENNITDAEEIKAFERQNYRFDQKYSDENTFVFVKGKTV